MKSLASFVNAIVKLSNIEDKTICCDEIMNINFTGAQYQGQKCY